MNCPVYAHIHPDNQQKLCLQVNVTVLIANTLYFMTDTTLLLTKQVFFLLYDSTPTSFHLRIIYILV